MIMDLSKSKQSKNIIFKVLTYTNIRTIGEPIFLIIEVRERLNLFV